MARVLHTYTNADVKYERLDSESEEKEEKATSCNYRTWGRSNQQIGNDRTNAEFI